MMYDPYRLPERGVPSAVPGYPQPIVRPPIPHRIRWAEKRAMDAAYELIKVAEMLEWELDPKWIPFMSDYKTRMTHVNPFQYAQLELGTQEAAGPLTSNPRIDEYLRTVVRTQKVQDGIPWCSAFVAWCHLQAGRPHTGSAQARSWLEWGYDVTLTPKAGDVVIFWRNSAKGSKGHVGFYVRENKNQIAVLGGNQHNEVCVAPYHKSRLLGIRRDLYYRADLLPPLPGPAQPGPGTSVT